jgi:hypothetical protein
MRPKPKMLTIPEAREAIRALQEIPGVGPNLARDLASLGILRVADLKGKRPEALYLNLERQMGTHIDRCVLYVFRCAVYYAETKRPNPARLKWWAWKDPELPAGKRRRRPPAGPG